MRRLAAAAVTCGMALAGCSGSSPTPGSSTAGRSSGPASTAATGATPATPTAGSASPSGESDVGLPAPQAPRSPAPSTAGSLDAASLPVPAGWRAVAREGGVEQGYLGNGTPAHARDPRRAAYEIMGVGCAPVTRAAWTDPTSALELDLVRSGQPGVGDAMVFATPAQAKTWFSLFTRQLAACASGTSPRTTRAAATATTWAGRRDYAGSESWSEVASVTGSTVRLYLLSDPDHRVTAGQQQALLARLHDAG